jgi:hypothetical protein
VNSELLIEGVCTMIPCEQQAAAGPGGGGRGAGGGPGAGHHAGGVPPRQDPHVLP